MIIDFTQYPELLEELKDYASSKDWPNACLAVTTCHPPSKPEICVLAKININTDVEDITGYFWYRVNILTVLKAEQLLFCCSEEAIRIAQRVSESSDFYRHIIEKESYGITVVPIFIDMADGISIQSEKRAIKLL